MKVLCKRFKIKFNDVSLKLSTINICVVHSLCHLQKVLVRDLYYTKRGKKDAEMGDIAESTSFVSILSNCADFKTLKRIKLTPQEKVAAQFMILEYASVSLGKHKRK